MNFLGFIVMVIFWIIFALLFLPIVIVCLVGVFTCWMIGKPIKFTITEGKKVTVIYLKWFTLYTKINGKLYKQRQSY